MQGLSFNGSINNGDVVEIDAPSRAGEVLKANSVRNRTAGCVVTSEGIRRTRVISAILLLLAAACVIGMIAFFVGAANTFMSR
jgi:predicted aconitase with swiveling domain